MTPQEYKHIRQRVLSLSQIDLAKKLGTNARTIYRREIQQGAIKPEHALAIQQLQALKQAKQDKE